MDPPGVGNALATIRDDELHRETHKSFKAYCEERWGFSRQHAYRLIEAAEVEKDVSPKGAEVSPRGDTLPPSGEKQMRSLSKLPKDQRAAAWADAVDGAGGKQPTAAQVGQVVQRYAADNEPYKEPSRGGKKEPPKPVKALTGAEREAFDARAQIKVWYEAVGRWLSNRPSIDNYRNKWPGPEGDRVVKAATELYEALRKWQRKIK